MAMMASLPPFLPCSHSAGESMGLSSQPSFMPHLSAAASGAGASSSPSSSSVVVLSKGYGGEGKAATLTGSISSFSSPLPSERRMYLLLFRLSTPQISLAMDG